MAKRPDSTAKLPHIILGFISFISFLFFFFRHINVFYNCNDTFSVVHI